jgi:hypothetical protein
MPSEIRAVLVRLYIIEKPHKFLYWFRDPSARLCVIFNMLTSFNDCQRLRLSVQLRAVRHSKQDRSRDRVFQEHFDLSGARASRTHAANMANQFHQGDVNKVRILAHNDFALLFDEGENDVFGWCALNCHLGLKGRQKVLDLRRASLSHGRATPLRIGSANIAQGQVAKQFPGIQKGRFPRQLRRPDHPYSQRGRRLPRAISGYDRSGVTPPFDAP